MHSMEHNSIGIYACPKQKHDAMRTTKHNLKHHKAYKTMKTNSKSLQKQHGYKSQNTEYKLKQYKLKMLKVSPLQNDEKL